MMLDFYIPGVSMSNSAFQITLPKFWSTVVRSAMLHVVSVAKYAAVYTRSWAADSHCRSAACQSLREFPRPSWRELSRKSPECRGKQQG